MTHRLIFDFTKIKLNLILRRIKMIEPIIFILLWCFVSPTVNADIEGGDCSTEGTPLAICKYYSDYIKSNNKLNYEYKKVLKLINGDNLSLLKKTQRQWIAWRDERCGETEKVICGMALCRAILHDECIIELTEQRTNELQKFAKSPKDAAKRNFDFSRKNKYLDDE